MTITKDGYIGIGTTSSAYKLHVNGAINATSLLVNGVPVGSGGSQWDAAGNNIYFNSGNIGNGTTTPITTLQIGSFSSSSHDEFLTIASVGGNSYRAGLKLRHWASDNGWNIMSDERQAGC